MPSLPFSASQMLTLAQQETGIDYDDGAILPALQKLVDSFNADGNPHEQGAQMLHQRVLRSLKNRVRMGRDFKAHPEIFDQRIARPIFICGMARTSSTKTQKLLASSGDFNFLTYWKALNPALYSGDPTESPQARIEDAEQYAKWFDEQSPDTKYGHSFEAHEPEEDSDILGHSMVSPVWFGWAPLGGYLEWLGEIGLSKQFETLRNTLKYLQWQGLATQDKRWILKCPLYSGLEPLLLEVFPDATLIMTHRTNVQTIGSGLRLLECFYQPFTDLRPEPDSYVEGVKGATDLHMKWRAEQPSDRFLDIPFSASIKDPDRCVREMYRYAGETLSEVSFERMRLWTQSNPQNKYGKHQYSLAQYGLTESGIREAFAEYEAFNDGLEAAWGY